MIPRVIHQIWLGDRQMPPIMARWAARWRELHPDWLYRLWDEDALRIVETPEIERILAACCHLSQRSNVYRYLILRDFGGLYVDTDMEPTRPNDPLIDIQDHDGEALLADEAAWIAGPARHPLFVALCADLRASDAGTSLSFGKDYLTSHAEHAPHVTRLPRELFYPIPWNAPDLFADASAFPGAYAVHRWSSFWFPHSFAKPVRPWVVTTANCEPYLYFARELERQIRAAGYPWHLENRPAAGEAPYQLKRHALRYAFDRGADCAYSIDADMVIRDVGALAELITPRSRGIHTTYAIDPVPDVGYWSRKPGNIGEQPGQDLYARLLAARGLASAPSYYEAHTGYCCTPDEGLAFCDAWDRVALDLRDARCTWSDGIVAGIAAAAVGLPIIADLPVMLVNRALAHLSVSARKGHPIPR